jgi:hypothetical protein
MASSVSRRQAAHSRGKRTVAVMIVVATCFLGAVTHADRFTTGAVASAPATRGPQMRTDGGMPPRVVLISDSAISGIRWYGRQSFLTGTSWETYLESCRRLVSPSCRGREGYAPRTAAGELSTIAATHGPAGPNDLLVVAVGYNDYDTQFRSDFATVTTRAYDTGFKRIVWLTYRELNGYHIPLGGRSDYAAMNAIMREELASGRWPGVALWEYDQITRAKPEWFYADGIHVTPSGAERVAEVLSSQLELPLP